MVSALGEWETEAILFCEAVPVVLHKYDSSRPFVPIPAPRTRPDTEKEKHCRFWLSERRCARGDACRYLHADVGSDVFLREAKQMLEVQSFKRANKVFDALDPHAGKKARKSQRARLFAEWLIASFGRGRVVLDIAGGTGALARTLISSGLAAQVRTALFCCSLFTITQRTTGCSCGPPLLPGSSSERERAAAASPRPLRRVL
jgi:hypothetical protein